MERRNEHSADDISNVAGFYISSDHKRKIAIFVKDRQARNKVIDALCAEWEITRVSSHLYSTAEEEDEPNYNTTISFYYYSDAYAFEKKHELPPYEPEEKNMLILVDPNIAHELPMYEKAVKKNCLIYVTFKTASLIQFCKYVDTHNLQAKLPKFLALSGEEGYKHIYNRIRD